uniref:Armadillo repeat containing 5 n=1 Tax=Neogobius melanostomus TaxID=47308 RepID=A0A8C6SXQ4_9GOBI
EAMRKHVALLSIQNRAARVLGNLAMYPENSALVHAAGETLCHCFSTLRSSAARALFYLSDTPCHRVSLVSQGAVAALCPLVGPELPVALRRASLRALHELTRGCGVDCARQLVRCGALAQLGLALEPGEEGGALEELALKTLANLCAQGCLRPLVGSLGAVRRFVEEVKKDALKSGLFLKALCLCCKEAVNRAKVKECGGLELLIGFLAAHQSHPLSRFVIQACVDFVFDEAAVEQFLELGLAPLLVERLVRLSKGEEPVSAFRLSSPLRRRPRDKPCVLRLPLETPPSLTRPTSYHPYHPEPWTPESPVLLLLSRFSHVSDPSAALANCAAVSGLLLYLTSRGDPSGRCFRMLLRLSNNPNCLQALVRAGAGALIRYRLCDRGEGEDEEGEEPRGRPRTRLSLLTNLQLQCESGFGAGVLSHIMLSGTESDRLHCALSLPLLTSNKTLLRKLLLDGGGLQFVLQPLGGNTDSDQTDPAQTQTPDLPLRSLYCPLLVGCLSALTALAKPSNKTRFGATDVINERVQPPPGKKPRLDQPPCPYDDATFDLTFLLDDGAEIPANRVAVSGEETSSGSEYFRALLRGGFGEADGEGAIPIGDVSAAMLTPVLHYLHGCRLANGDATRGRCRALEAVVNARPSRSDDFEKTALGEAMIGACRFLVGDLQKELEEVCVSLLDSGDIFEKENAASRSPVAKDELTPGNGSCSSVLDLLPEIYWFSQRHSYRRLGASCLSLLTRPRFSQAKAGECLSRLAREADSVDALRKDLVALAANALS